MRDTGAETWRDWLLTRRSYAGITPSELSELAGVSRATIYRWQDGTQSPERPELVQRVARALGAPLDEAMRAAGMHPDVVEGAPTGTSMPDPNWYPIVVELNQVLSVVPEETRDNLVKLVDTLIAPYRRRAPRRGRSAN